MHYVDAMVAAVPTDAKDAYLAHAKFAAEIFKKHGAVKLVDLWGDDVPDGELTSFPMAVKAEPGETVVVSWIIWPSKQARDAGMQAVMADPDMDSDAHPIPFDGKRLIFGGFKPLFETAETPKSRTCLWFQDAGEQAAAFYVSLLPDSEVTHVWRPDPDGPVVVVEFTLAGTPYMILNGGPTHELSPAASISIATRDQAETDRLWDALTANGGRESRCGWLVDRYGVSWQIVPEALPKMLSSDDRAAADRAMAAMMTMNKIDIAALEATFSGE